jgi:signal transduction histidine kinase
MLRNKEIKIYLTLLLSIVVTGSVISFFFDLLGGIAAFLSLVLMLAISFFFTRWRYQQLDELSGYLKRITGGEYSLDIRDNDEGELSILKSEIYKVTVTLAEQAELLKKDKLFLADSIADISHQLKTPLTSMFVMTDLLFNEKLPQDKRMEFILNIRAQIFNRFYKGRNAHNDSIGIGLAMSKSILQKQSGTIEAVSEKGEGTQFTIKIYKRVV